MEHESWTTSPSKTIDCREYIKPGKYHNRHLYTDMEAARKEGFNVFVTGTDGKTTVAWGTPDTDYDGFFANWPWSDGEKSGPTYYATARECMMRLNGTQNPKASELYRKEHKSNG